MEKCPSCGKQYARDPILKNPQLPLEEKYKPDNLIWKNLFRMRLEWIFIMIAIFMIIIGFNQFTAECQEAIENPCSFCNQTGCCLYQTEDPFTVGPGFNFSKLKEQGGG